jgi:GTP-binding protein
VKSRNELPAVVLAGRKNVGKSSIFNRLVGYRRSLVADYEGLTRDPVIFDTEINEKPVRLVDLPGYFIDPQDDIEKEMNASFREWIERAALIVFVVDGRSDITKEDMEIADLVRKSGKPYIFVVNKTEYKPVYFEHISDLYALSMGEPLEVAAEHGMGFEELIDEISKNLPDVDFNVESPSIRVAIVGKPNVGKSSLLNAILGEKFSMVTDIPGTTRDTLDATMNYKGREIVFIDTAGLRRRSRVKKGTVESFSGARTIRAIMNSDISVIVIDASEGITTQDKKIASLVQEYSKAPVVAMNKWDIRMAYVEENVQREFFFMDYCPKVAISAKNNWNVEGLLDEIITAYDAYTTKIATSQIAKAASEFAYSHAMPSKRGRKLKIYYATQISTAPPTFSLFVNFPDLFNDSTKRSFVNFLRRAIPQLSSSPIKVVVKARR